MSLNLSGEKCALCKAYLFEEDDVVYCPECGAPHHRECYNGIGHCALDGLHGTENQYKKPQPEEKEVPIKLEAKAEGAQKTVCNMCGEVYDREAPICPSCKAPNISKMGGRVISIDLLGGVPAEKDLGNGVTADEAKLFVVTNSQRYVPKFAAFKSGKKASWNWLAFLVPSAWFFSRKMYALGAVASALQIAFMMLTFPFAKATNYLDFSGARNYVEIGRIIAENLPNIGIVAVLSALLGSALVLLLKILSGIFGDRLYYGKVVSEVKEIKENSDDKIEDFRRKGGVNLILAMVGIMLVDYLPSIFASLFGLL